MQNPFGPAFSRIVLKAPLDQPWLDMAPNLVADALLFALAWHDRKALGRIHPVTLGAMLLLIPLHALTPSVAVTDWWTAAATQIYGFG